MILSIAVFEDWLVRLEREDGLPRIVVRDLSSGAEHAIAFDEEAYSLDMDAGAEFDTNLLRFTYSSMTTPAETYDYDMASRARVLRKRQEVPSGHDPARYVTRRLMAPAADGETVPVSLLYRNDTALDGSAPCLLYGYGAYGISIPAAFSTTALSLVDRGFVHAIAHIRGGTEKGWRWYREGKLAKKPNSFSDFIACGEYLAGQHFTQPRAHRRARRLGRRHADGRGRESGARPLRRDRRRGALRRCADDHARRHAAADAARMARMGQPDRGQRRPSRRSSPTALSTASRPRHYPPILALAGLTDSRVTYWEAAKWVARLRALKTDANPLLLRVNMDAGHGGASGRFDRLEEVALVQAFAATTMGRTELIPGG